MIKKGDRVAVYGYVEIAKAGRAKFLEGGFSYCSGHSAKVLIVDPAYDIISVRFDGNCGKLSNCIVKGALSDDVQIKQCRKLAKPKKTQRHVKK